MKKITLIIFALFALLFNSCKKDEVVDTNLVAFTASATGSQEVPAITTTATGSFTGSFDKTTKILTYTITYAGLTPTLWHIHNGAKGVAGPVVFNIGTMFTSPFKSATIALTAAQETDLMAGNYYLNIHTAVNKGGEIRGQISKN